MQVPFYKPDYDECEEQAVVNVLRSGVTSYGQKAQEVEHYIKSFIGRNSSVVATNSCTSALELALLASGVDAEKPKYIVFPNVTYPAALSFACTMGQNIGFADIDAFTGCIIPAYYDADIIVAACYAGNIPNLKTLREMNSKAIIILDSAHYFGLGLYHTLEFQFVNYICFSFHATKNVSGGEGGAIVFNNNDYMYHKIKAMALHGKTNEGSERVFGMFGGKRLMSDLHAAIILEQFKKLKDNEEKRIILWSRYEEYILKSGLGLSSLIRSPGITNVNCSMHIYPIFLPLKLKNLRTTIRINLKRLGVETRVHYPYLPNEPVYQRFNYASIEEETLGKEFVARTFSLPFYPSMTVEEQDYVIECLDKCVREELYKVMKEEGEKNG